MENNQKNQIPDEALTDISGGARSKRQYRNYTCQFCQSIFESPSERDHHIEKCPQNPKNRK